MSRPFTVLCSGLLLAVLLISGFAVSPARVAAQEPPAPAEPAPGGFVEASGSQFMRLGQPAPLKSVYYEPIDYAPYEMWRYWDSTRLAHDLSLLREHTGANVVWMRLPYGVWNVTPEGQISDEMALRIRETIQVVGALDMRVVFTLFHGYEAFPMPGRNSERLNMAYLDTLLTAFGNDERVLGWDIYHQPDSHSLWGADRERVLSWLVRMANHAQKRAPNQLIFVSLSDYSNVWEPDFDGHILLSFVDAILLRGRNVEDVVEGIEDIRTRTDKPIVLYDFAWSSGPPCRRNAYTEEQQAAQHRPVLELLRQGQLAGISLRQMFDFNSGPYGTWADRRFYEGVFDFTYRPKLVTQVLREYAVPPLLNTTQTNYPLRIEEYKPPRVENEADDGEPRQVEGSEHYVKGDIRRAWDTFGGRYSFGMPLTEAYKRAEDNRVVQYFEGAVMVLHPDARSDEDYAELGRFEKLMARVQIMPIGEQYTTGREFPVPAEKVTGARHFPETGHYIKGEFRSFYKRANGDWRFGNPISEELIEEINGVPTRVQYFERGRLEWNEETQTVQVSPLGSWRFAVQCQNMP